MAKKNKEKKSNVAGKVIFSVVLAVGSAVAAYVASKFLGKKGELEQPAPENDLDVEMTEDNYITLDNEVIAEDEDEIISAEEIAAEMPEAAVEAEEAETVEDETATQAPADDISDDDATKCIRD